MGKGGIEMKHKHAELIKAWADGAEIEVYQPAFGRWEEAEPAWHTSFEYRIKPEPKPDIVLWASMHPTKSNVYYSNPFGGANLKLTWDEKTRKLKSAEVLK